MATISPTAPSTHPAPTPPVEDPGYIERAVIWIRDTVVDLFNRVYTCVRRALGYDVAPPPTEKEKERVRAESLLDRLNRGILRDIDASRAFEKYLTPEERVAAYYKIVYENRDKLNVYERNTPENGQILAARLPRLLYPFLRQALQSALENL